MRSIADKAGPEFVDQCAGNQPRFSEREGLVQRLQAVGPRVDGNRCLGLDNVGAVNAVTAEIRYLIGSLVVDPTGDVILPLPVVEWETITDVRLTPDIRAANDCRAESCCVFCLAAI